MAHRSYYNNYNKYKYKISIIIKYTNNINHRITGTYSIIL